MRKAWLWVAVVGAGVVGAALLASILYFDVIAHRLIVRGSTYALGVDTSLDSTSLGLLSGSFGLKGLEVANPAGFEEPLFLRVGDAELDLDLQTLRQPALRVPRFEIHDVEVDLDQQQGQANYAAILKNLARFESGDPEPTGAEASAEPGKRFVIEQLVIRDVEAHVRVREGGLLGKVDVLVPEVLMRNLGGDGKPLTAAELTSVIVKAVLASIVQVGAGLPGGLGKALGQGLGLLGDVSFEVPEGEGSANAAAGALGTGAAAAGDALDSGRSAVRETSKKLKGLGGRLRDKD